MYSSNSAERLYLPTALAPPGIWSGEPPDETPIFDRFAEGFKNIAIIIAVVKGSLTGRKALWTVFHWKRPSR
jgi:hypothetical protein